MRDNVVIDEASAVERVSSRKRKENPSILPVKSSGKSLSPSEPEEEAQSEQPTTPENNVSKEVSSERGRKPEEAGDYETLFIRNAPSTTRSGKAVYIRKEFHEKITRIVQVIGYNELSLFSYIDNVLEHHFNQYLDEISELYRKRNPKTF